MSAPGDREQEALRRLHDLCAAAGSQKLLGRLEQPGDFVAQRQAIAYLRGQMDDIARDLGLEIGRWVDP